MFEQSYKEFLPIDAKYKIMAMLDYVKGIGYKLELQLVEYEDKPGYICYKTIPNKWTRKDLNYCKRNTDKQYRIAAQMATDMISKTANIANMFD